MSSPANQGAKSSRSQRLVVPSVAFLYFGGVLLRDNTIEWPTVLSPDTLVRFAVRYELLAFVLMIPSTAAAWLAYSRVEGRTVRLSKPAAVFGITALASWVLAELRWWPFTWQLPQQGTALEMTALLVNDKFLVIMLACARLGVLVPAIEEFLFRSALLSWFERRTGSFQTSIVLQGVSFGILHYGNVANLALSTLNVLWLCFFGIALGFVARRHGLLCAVAAHSARNTVELATLLAEVARVAP